MKQKRAILSFWLLLTIGVGLSATFAQQSPTPNPQPPAPIVQAAAGPGIEFLEYLTPRDGRPLPADEHANDLMHWQTRLMTGDTAAAAQQVRAGTFAFVSPGTVALPKAVLGFKKGFLLRDPDGHVMQLTEH